MNICFMKKLLACLSLSALLFAFAPTARAADLYANELVSNSFFDLLSPQNAIGEPDGLYADFRDQDTYLKLDMGAGEEGNDGLTLFVSLIDYGATAVVTFYSEDGAVTGSANTLFAPGTAEWTATYYGTEPFRFVKIESPETDQWRLDAVQATAITTPVDDAPVVTDPTPEEPTVDDSELQSNDLIKLADSDAVYVIGDDGKRHPFPNEVTFYSWGYSFENVTVVDTATMSSYLIGGSVTVKPGSYLVKIQSVPKVYAVAPNHTLRWIDSEETAVEVFGAGWANEVIDVSDAFWPDYTAGELIDSADDLEGWEIETQPY